MLDFCIIGSGVAGSTIAKSLSKKYSLHVYDKAKGIGGRSSNKRLRKNLSYDHGVQYIAPKTKKFQAFINDLYIKRVLKKWNGNHLDFTFKKNGSSKFIGFKANNDLPKFQLKRIKTYCNSQVTKIAYLKNFWEITFNNKLKRKFKAVILTCPYPQTKKLGKKYFSKNFLNLKISMKPNITLMLATKGKKIPSISSIKINDDIIAWIANENSKKRFMSDTNLWTIQTSLKFSKKYINDYKINNKIINLILLKFLQLTGFKNNEIVFKKIHGWKYSYNLDKTSLKSFWDTKLNFGICADWFNGPKVEDAWISANDLLEKIKKNPLI